MKTVVPAETTQPLGKQVPVQVDLMNQRKAVHSVVVKVSVPFVNQQMESVLELRHVN